MRRDELPPGQRWIERPVVYDIAAVLPVELDAFRLRVHGAVDHPAALSWAELAQLPRVKATLDFHCVTTWSVRGIVWEGIPVSELIRRVRPHPDVRWVLARGRDGYATSLPYEALAHPESLLADRMDGETLPRQHGFPLRLVVPSLYAWKSAKYLEEIEFRRDLARGYWEERGYHDQGDPWLEERFRENP
jgi:DMSO/TMAO reductase YedYZ molybdopterin-dependent catalytic subunit